MCFAIKTDRSFRRLGRSPAAINPQAALTLNNENVYIGSGGFGFTDELPQPGFDGRVRLKDLWGSASTQIFVDVSPAMHEEFALQYEARVLNRFGLVTYGCCEPLCGSWRGGWLRLQHSLCNKRRRRCGGA